jgi:hypothetical protein
MLNKVVNRSLLSRQFSSGSSVLKVKKALLLPSKIPIYPFQSHVSVISDDDRDTIKRLGFQNAVMSVENKYLEDIPEHFMEIIRESEKLAVKLVSEAQMNDLNKDKESANG